MARSTLAIATAAGILGCALFLLFGRRDGEMPGDRSGEEAPEAGRPRAQRDPRAPGDRRADPAQGQAPSLPDVQPDSEWKSVDIEELLDRYLEARKCGNPDLARILRMELIRRGREVVPFILAALDKDRAVTSSSIPLFSLLQSVATPADAEAVLDLLVSCDVDSLENPGRAKLFLRAIESVLRDIVDVQAGPRLERILESARSAPVRTMAARLLARAGCNEARYVQALLRALRGDTDDGVRDAAATSLGEMKAMEVLPEMIYLLQQPETTWGVLSSVAAAISNMLPARQAVALLLDTVQAATEPGFAGEIGTGMRALARNPDGKEVLIESLLAERRKEPRMAVLVALMDASDPAVGKLLGDAFETDRDVDLRDQALIGLSINPTVEEDRVRRLVEEALASPGPPGADVRSAGIAAVNNLLAYPWSREWATQRLLGILSSDWRPADRRHALRCLADWPDVGEDSVLEEVARNDPSEEVRQQAAWAVEKRRQRRATASPSAPGTQPPNGPPR